MAEIELVNGGVAIVDDEDLPRLSKMKWRRTPNGYARSGAVMMHRLIKKARSRYQVDHIDGDKLNNRRANLREVSPHKNSWNKTKERPDVGVTAFRGAWKAVIGHRGCSIHLGVFQDKDEAVRARSYVAARLRKEFYKGPPVEFDPAKLSESAQRFLASGADHRSWREDKFARDIERYGLLDKLPPA